MSQDWALAIRPVGKGWMVKCMHMVEQVPEDGHLWESLDEALEDIRVLAELLKDDPLTQVLADCSEWGRWSPAS